jgi:threonine/homoserine/homoserine lactone efflux protein
MFETIITVLLIGFVAGFVFAIPIAGPVSILITSNALKGKKRFCIRTALGASIAEAVYVLAAVYGMTLVFSSYNFLIPYLLIIGAVFLMFVARKVLGSKLQLQDIQEAGLKVNKDIEENKGGLRTGLIINFTNPSLFFGLLTSSFIVLSFASSVGLHTGGLEFLMEKNVATIQEYTGSGMEKIDSVFFEKKIDSTNKSQPASYSLLLSLIYAVFLAAGGFVWFYILTSLLIKYREKIKLSYLNFVIRGLGAALFVIGFFLLWKGGSIVFGQLG